MKKHIIKAAAFLLVFCLLFQGLQEVLHYKAERDEDMIYRYDAYLQEPEDSIDILFVGSSPTYAGIVPALIWKETGMTSINLGISQSAAIINYYQLRFALQTQTPTLVVMDFNSICRDSTADSSPEMEAAYRKQVEALPDWKLKTELILQIGKDNPKQDIWTYFAPLLQYHPRWNEITKADFTDTEAENFKDYKKGAFFSLRDPVEGIIYDPMMFEQELEDYPLSEYSWEYYQKALELCEENHIPVAVVTFPKSTTEDLVREWQTLEKICAEKGINYYNINNPTIWAMCDMDTETDFYDSGHVNASGAVKVSKVIAQLLQEDYDLPDHRSDAAYSSWAEDWDAFYADYENVLSEFDY